MTNTGNIPDTLSVSYDSNQWQVTIPVTSFILEAGESVEVIVYVSVADNVLAGDEDEAIITVTSQGDPGQSDQVELTTTAVCEEVYLPVILKYWRSI
jgi:hypothetical protein